MGRLHPDENVVTLDFMRAFHAIIKIQALNQLRKRSFPPRKAAATTVVATVAVAPRERPGAKQRHGAGTNGASANGCVVKLA